MLRWMMSVLVALLTIDYAAAADSLVVDERAPHHPARQLPPGLPHAHYKYRTTIAPPIHVRGAVLEEPESLLSPLSDLIPYIPPLTGKPFLLGSSTIPGYYGRAADYEYDGPYYGGPYVRYWNRLPYACGVYGYC